MVTRDSERSPFFNRTFARSESAHYRGIVTAFQRCLMGAQLATTFTGLRFETPFLLASAPPTESDSNIMRAYEAGWGGVVTKTIGLHPVVHVDGPKTKFLPSTPD